MKTARETPSKIHSVVWDGHFKELIFHWTTFEAHDARVLTSSSSTSMLFREHQPIGLQQSFDGTPVQTVLKRIQHLTDRLSLSRFLRVLTDNPDFTVRSAVESQGVQRILSSVMVDPAEVIAVLQTA